MSSWVCSDDHIRLIVTGASRLGLLPEDTDLDHLTTTLARENVISVDFRYGRETPKRNVAYSPVYGVSKPAIIVGMMKTKELLNIHKQVCCYDYQSCVHLGWDNSDAKGLCDRITDAVEEALDMTYNQVTKSPIYSKLRWGV
jgi:hypothetical protein